MKIETIQIIKETLEKAKSITVLSMSQDNNILFGVYINNVRDSLSFLSLPKSHFETTINEINIQFFELGAVLHSIYFNGALKFIDILIPDDGLMTPSEDYLSLCSFVLDNIPFNIAKLKYIEAVNENFTYENDIEKVSMLLKIMLDFKITLMIDLDVFDSIEYVTSIDNENDFIKACNYLNKFKEYLQGETYPKISEKNMYKMDKMYIDIQISHLNI